MAVSVNDYTSWMEYKACDLYYDLIYVVGLENYFPDKVEDCRVNIRRICNYVITTFVKNKVYRGACVVKYLLEPTVGQFFEDYCEEVFIDAFNNEIDSVNKKIAKGDKGVEYYSKELDAINAQVLPNLSAIVNDNKARFEKFYNMLINAAENRDDTMLDDIVDGFIDGYID